MSEPYYTTAAAVRTELGLTVGALSDAAALVLIQSAEDQVDYLLGARPIDGTTLRKVVQAEVETWQWTLLARATTVLAAQLYSTPNLLTQQTWNRVKGPDFEFEGPQSGPITATVLGPLTSSGLRVLSGRAVPTSARDVRITEDQRTTWGPES